LNRLVDQKQPKIDLVKVFTEEDLTPPEQSRTFQISAYRKALQPGAELSFRSTD
jgi:hypothetical protein